MMKDNLECRMAKIRSNPVVTDDKLAYIEAYFSKKIKPHQSVCNCCEVWFLLYFCHMSSVLKNIIN